MNGNVGMSDRVLRMFLGMAIAGFGILNNSVWAALGIPVFLTGVIGICPLYSLFRIKTFGKADSEH